MTIVRVVESRVYNFVESADFIFLEGVYIFLRKIQNQKEIRKYAIMLYN